VDDAAEIRALLERWADAVHAGDLETVVADHAADIVMFDVPPPDRGVRGIDAYRDTWPPFFEWQLQGASLRSRSSTSLRVRTSPSPGPCSDAERPRS
jgi:ketosteroid isomerase-like protein